MLCPGSKQRVTRLNGAGGELGGDVFLLLGSETDPGAGRIA